MVTSLLGSADGNLVLTWFQQQKLLVLNRKSSARPRLRNTDRLVLMWLYRLLPSVLDAIIIVKPETVLSWHRRGFPAGPIHFRANR